MVKLTVEDARVVCKQVGAVFVLFSFFALAPLLLSLALRHSPRVSLSFLACFAVTLLFGLAVKRASKTSAPMLMRHALAATAVVWLLAPLFGGLPFLFSGKLGLLDSYVESASTLTSAGTEFFPDLDSVPRALLFWRDLLCWLGSFGIVALALTGVLGGAWSIINLYKAEGREDRLRPNLLHTVRQLLAIYCALTLIAFALLFVVVKMPFLDAVQYAMGAISTNGMTTTNAGISGYGYLGLVVIALLSVVGSVSMVTHDRAFKGDWQAYFRDKSLRVFLLISFASFVLLSIKFGQTKILLETAAQVFMAITGGGFALLPLPWDEISLLLLVALMFIGGCAGSYAGGIKIERFVIFVKSVWWELEEIIAPASIIRRRALGREVSPEEIKDVAVFIAFFAVLVLVNVFVLAQAGLSVFDSLFTAVSAQSCNGMIPAGVNAWLLPGFAKVSLALAMILGRLEIYPVLSLLTFAAGLLRK
ncbi:MAG: potassium transporter TrkG [Candidatus Norongarragalinales archaeon]